MDHLLHQSLIFFHHQGQIFMAVLPILCSAAPVGWLLASAMGCIFMENALEEQSSCRDWGE